MLYGAVEVSGLVAQARASVLGSVQGVNLGFRVQGLGELGFRV